MITDATLTEWEQEFEFERKHSDFDDRVPLLVAEVRRLRAVIARQSAELRELDDGGDDDGGDDDGGDDERCPKCGSNNIVNEFSCGGGRATRDVDVCGACGHETQHKQQEGRR